MGRGSSSRLPWGVDFEPGLHLILVVEPAAHRDNLLRLGVRELHNDPTPGVLLDLVLPAICVNGAERELPVDQLEGCFQLTLDSCSRVCRSRLFLQCV